MLSPNAQRNISRIIPFGVIWFVFGIIYLTLEKGLLGDLQLYPSTGNRYHFGAITLILLSFITVMGLLVGAIEVFYFNKRFTRSSLFLKVLFKTTIYAIIIIAFLMIISSLVTMIDLQTNVFDKRVWNNTWIFVSSFVFWSVELYIAAIIFISIFYAEVSENMGHEVLRNFFTGKYHNPIEEERIFMFLDMKSSTTIAEKLGHVKYFEMLAEYYSDMSSAIVQHEGEIYQYVGDEVVVSWKPKSGLNNNNCVNCFYEMKKALIEQSGKYQTKFGVLPSFKAGLHIGNVTTGEIGVIKKDILFTGDVLNTTARIQGLCNDFKVEVLVSGDLYKKMDLTSVYEVNFLGEKELRGRGKKVELFTVIPRL